ncbi:centrosomal protein of 76 kDa-like isoform X1 [Panulirus ornatus]|uniref:centrosomal protein of 76 kDa-like isoform X1 n=1 Tax=Panulirus ornatus TaxID=150431 RepID=UPI003A8A294C
MAEESIRVRSVEDAIRSEIEKENLQSAIDKLIREVVSEEAGQSSVVNPESIVARLLDSSTIQSLVQRVSASSRKAQTSHFPTGNLPLHVQEQIVPGRRYLYLRVCNGRAFVDHLKVKTSPAVDNQSYLTFHLALRSQRFETHGVPCVCEPAINEGFLFDLQLLKPDHGNILDCSELLTLDAPITLAAVRQEGLHRTATTLLSVYILDWRSVLARTSATTKLVCHLMGIGSEQQVPVGLLDLEATMFPSLELSLQTTVVSEYIQETNNRVGERRRLFIAYARQWWQEYTEASSSHSLRPVRIFSMDECGKNRFACEFVQKLEVGRALRSPEEAARWISILPTTSANQSPIGPCKPWYTLPTALMVRSLNTESKCSVLCSILLGFGLDAWVCVGTRHSGNPHVWVMTRGPYSAITFWETLTGSRYIHRVGQKAAHDYGTIASIFNNYIFFANCQASDKVEYCNFFLDNSSSWKKMSDSATSSMIEKVPCLMPLTPASDDGNKRSVDMEVQLQVLIIEHRSDAGLSTQFNEHLGYILTPALWSYEREAVNGGDNMESRGAELFSAALMHTVPDGHTFKAFPFHFTHRSPRRAFNTILNSSIGREIVECRGDRVTLAIRSVTVCYPEHVFVTWLMVACSYRPVG